MVEGIKVNKKYSIFRIDKIFQKLIIENLSY